MRDGSRIAFGDGFGGELRIAFGDGFGGDLRIAFGGGVGSACSEVPQSPTPLSTFARVPVRSAAWPPVGSGGSEEVGMVWEGWLHADHGGPPGALIPISICGPLEIPTRPHPTSAMG